MGGPSVEAKANEAAQTAFYQETTAQQKTVFGENQDIYNRVLKVVTPIIAKGPLQFGFTPEVDALLKTDIIDRSNASTANVINATQLAERQKAGGAQVLPSGASAQLEEDARVLGEQSKNKQLSEEKLTGYKVGSEMYNNAVSQLSGITGRPTEYTNAATGAGSNATGAINLADSERSTLLASLLTGAVSGAAQVGASYVGKPPCWVARAVYGDDNPMWVIFRDKFFDGRFPILNALYLRFGERFAELVKRSKLLKAVVKRLMDKVING